MSNKAKISSRGRQRILAFSFAIFAAFGLMQTSLLPAFEASPTLKGEKLSPEAEKKLNLAGIQHDLILLLIEKRDFDSIEPEWKAVLDLKLGKEFEDLVGKSIVAISYTLLEAKRFALALKLLDESLAAAPFSDKSKANIYACKAALYKELKDVDSAIQAMRRAKDLEGKP
jgi:tetratricopeptide (TPR) repeat protein